MTRLVADSQQSGNLLSGTIRPDQIAVAGHSLGGLAALALAGGDDQACDLAWSWWIQTSSRPKPVSPSCPIHASRRSSQSMGRTSTSTMLKWPGSRSRVWWIGQEWSTLESMTARFGYFVARPHSAIQGHPNYRVDVAYANHMSFSSVCTYIHVLHDKGHHR